MIDVMRNVILFFALGCAVLLPASAGSAPASPADDFLDKMTGTWTMEGTVKGNTAHHVVTGEWMSNHRFVHLHERTADTAPASERRYDADWFLGYDEVSERYVMHLLDVYGARFSETLGYGVRDGNTLPLIFEYPDGPFHNTMRWSPQDNTWQWLLEQKDDKGKWTTFADLRLTRAHN